MGFLNEDENTFVFLSSAFFVMANSGIKEPLFAPKLSPVFAL